MRGFWKVIYEALEPAASDYLSPVTYGCLFEIKLSGRSPGMEFIDAGDQLIALSKGEKERPDGHPSGWWWTTSGP